MPALTEIISPIKGLLLAPSGAGKTGALWSLAAAGFKLRIYDADRGTGVLASALKDNPEALARIEVNTFTNALKGSASGFILPDGAPKAWPNFLLALNKWPDTPEEGPQVWGLDTVMVIDSLSILARHALLYAQHLEGKTGKQPEIQHYGTAMAQLQAVMETLYSDYVKCHVLVLTHITYVSDDLGVSSGMPMALGEKLPPILPRYFNTMLTIKSGAKSRKLVTKPTNMVQTKVEQFASVKDEYILVEGSVPRPGLAEFFVDCGWPGPKGTPK